MNKLTRREITRLIGATGTLAALGGLGFPVNARAQATSKVVVIGGGFGGATCAKYLRRYGPQLSITLIEPSTQYVSCPFSNTVLAGINPIDFVTFGYQALEDQHGIEVVTDRVTDVDPVAKSMTTAGGQKLGYDILVMSPGIDFRWDAIEGYDRAAAELMPHAWKPGEQTLLLKKQIEAMPDGGSLIIAPPVAPFRAPSGPYERASMCAYYFKQAKPNSKILIVDSRLKMEEHLQLHQAWDDLYPGMIDWIAGNGQLQRVDVKEMTVHSASGERYTGDVVNLIPPQQAGAIAHSADLVDETGWCPVDSRSFESTRHEGIYVIGDACIAGEMPKAASAANTQAKVCAAAIVAKISDVPLPEPFLVSVFYSLLGKKRAISEVSTYRVVDGQIRKTAGGVSAASTPATAVQARKTRRRELKFAEGWFESITSEAFG